MKEHFNLMFLGTGSDSGKSLFTAAFCRIFKRRGISVAPFKAQNMALNSFVTMDGREMGRAQVIQAYAAGLQPDCNMNPVLLKPSGGNNIQVIVRGRVVETTDSRDYYEMIGRIREKVLESYTELSNRYDAIILEGAGSAVELNLKDRDIVNLSMARAVNSPSVLIGDIDRGGIFASLIGSIKLMDARERKLIIGSIVNKFRGDIVLFEDGVRILERKMKRPVFGVMPYLKDLGIPEEDSVPLSKGLKGSYKMDSKVKIAVVRLPFISNYTDFDPFEIEEDVSLVYIDEPDYLDNFDAVIIPGTKSTIQDMLWMKKRGFDEKIRMIAASGRMVIGICGGYQMLGRSIEDPYHVESDVDETEGIGLIDMKTVLTKEKKLTRVRALSLLSVFGGNIEVTGYEIHMGVSRLSSRLKPCFKIIEKNGIRTSYYDGAQSMKRNVWGTYIHGLFENDAFRSNMLSRLGISRSSGLNYREYLENQFDRLADSVEENVKVDDIIRRAINFKRFKIRGKEWIGQS